MIPDGLPAGTAIDDGILEQYAKLANGDIFEIGTSYGRGAAILAANTGHTVFTINPLPEQIAGRYITHKLEKDEIGKYSRGYPNVVQIYGAAPYGVDIMPIDLVVIDGCHDYDYVVSDIKFALSLHPSYILIHDFHLVPIKDYQEQVRAAVIHALDGCMIKHLIGSGYCIVENV